MVLKKGIVFLLLLSIAFIGSTIYRPYIYNNNIPDLHFADFLPNLFSVPVTYAFYSFIYSILKKNINDKISTIKKITFGMVFYEFLQLFTGGFDVYDLGATFFGAGIVYFVVITPNKQQK